MLIFQGVGGGIPQILLGIFTPENGGRFAPF